MACVAGVAFIPGCHGAGKAAVGGSGGPYDRTPVILFCFWEQTCSSRSSSGGRAGHGAGPATTELEAKIKYTRELNMFHRGAGTTSREVLKGRGLSCTPLLRLKSPSDFTQHGRSKSDEASLHLVHTRQFLPVTPKEEPNGSLLGGTSPVWKQLRSGWGTTQEPLSLPSGQGSGHTQNEASSFSAI